MIMSLSAASLIQAAPKSPAPDSATEMGVDYFQTLKGQNGTLAGTPSLTISKYINQANDLDAANEDQPIGGIKFQYGKIGNLYKVKDGDTTVMAYGIDTKVATAAGIDGKADYTDKTMSYYTDGSVINKAVQEKDKEEFLNLGLTPQEGTTNGHGQIQATLDAKNNYGLYLVMETDVSGAYVTKEGKEVPISITRSRKPFVISIPTYISGQEGNGYWEENIKANVKNSTDDAEVEKKIVVGDNEELTDGNEKIADTDTTSIGDTVHFRLKGTVPSIPTDGKDITTYILTDNISKGLTPVTVTDESTNKGKVKIDSVRTTGGAKNPELQLGTDYNVSALSSYNEKESEYTNGNTFTITFTDAGLQKLSNWAKDQGEDNREIYFYYSAVVNENAVVGPRAEGTAENSGNPNEVKLTYQLKDNQEMNTSYDKVTEFTFGVDVTKQLNGKTDGITNENRKEIQFILYSEKEKAKTYYQLKETQENSGVYNMTNAPADNPVTEKSATKMSPAAQTGKIEIRGLEEGTYYLKEISTIKGYNLLKKPVEIEITGAKEQNSYIVDASNAGEKEYTGNLNKKDNTDGKVNLIVNNTSGFQLPATGGIGAGIFAVCGVLVIGAGIAYYVISRKKEKKAK